ncbi:LamG domain-containing protein [Candidatus Pacearchaeota archaeon]|jgi:hypothetical protein|nr:LamG domain-containing protein [Candidatus Pacearchaeota archaeon]
MIANASQSWRDNWAKNYNNPIRIYIDPRRIEYGAISGTETYYANTSSDPVNGRYSLSQSTSVYMAPFSMPITFECLVKPMWAYDVASDVEFFKFYSDSLDDALVSFCYYAADDTIGVKAYTSAGGASPAQVDTKLAKVYASNEDLQKWVRLTCTISASAIKIYSDGGNVISSASDISAHKSKVLFSPSNNQLAYINYGIIFYGLEASAAQVANRYLGLKNEQVFFNFQRSGIGRTRCDVTSYASDYSHEYKDGYTAATFSVSLKNPEGEFSADQYIPFAPESKSYNGEYAQRYLVKNPIGVSMEYWSKQKTGIEGLIAAYPLTGILNMPDCTAGVSYSQDAWATVDGWSTQANEGSLYIGSNCVRNVGVVAGNKIAIENTTGRASLAGDTFRIRIRANRTFTMEAFYYPSGAKTSLGTFTVGLAWSVFDAYMTDASDGIRIESTGNAADGDMFLIDFIYMGTGLYSSELIDSTGNGHNLTFSGAYPAGVLQGGGLTLDGANDFAMCDMAGQAVNSMMFWHSVKGYDNDAQPFSTLFDDGTDSYGFGMAYVNATTIRVHYGQGAGSVATYKDVVVSAYALNTLYHWGITYTAGDTYFRIYRNGVLVGTSAATTFDATAQVLAMGKYQWPNKHLLENDSGDYLISDSANFLENV